MFCSQPGPVPLGTCANEDCGGGGGAGGVGDGWSFSGPQAAVAALFTAQLRCISLFLQLPDASTPPPLLLPPPLPLLPPPAPQADDPFHDDWPHW
jgi:hypothetical protein